MNEDQDIHSFEYEFMPPDPCPSEIENIYSDETTKCSAWVIREHSRYGRRPHIYAKVCRTTSPDSETGVVVLSDTGCGTKSVITSNPVLCQAALTAPEICNLRTFLDNTINPGGRIPYLIILTHCHWDHILGLCNFPKAEPPLADNFPSKSLQTQIVASARGQFFAEPYSNLQKHSHCADLGLKAPHFQVTTWAYDFMEIRCDTHLHPLLNTNITVLHTQGHTPDSLSWYDSEQHIIHVGDSFHVNNVIYGENAEVASQGRIHTTFYLESDLAS